jgi:deazaflavin-dependent oxidoreductase (nitroreductase family)
VSDYNARVISEFRANGGVVPNFGDSIVLLHSTGARSGEARLHPVMSIPEPDGSWLIAASYAGAPTNPAWFHNLVTNPDAEIEVVVDGTIQTVPVTASVLEGAERNAGWATFTSRSPGFAAYEQKTDRVIPVLRLTRR